MACRNPITFYPAENGQWTPNRARSVGPGKLRPCGQCMSCRHVRRQETALRLVHESKMHRENMFVTLTYEAQHLPPGATVSKRELQLFMKRLRKYFQELGARIRFFACGEYGETNGRPHFHVLVFGARFSDAKGVPGNDKLYTSDALAKLWTKGFATFGAVTPDSCSYVCGYVCKKMTGKQADKHYEVFDSSDGVVYRREPEFALRSMRPGIGATFFQKFSQEIIGNDSCIWKGKKVPIPGYYLDLYERMVGKVDFEYEAFERTQRAAEYAELNAADLTEERRIVRDEVLQARMRQRGRSALG